MLLQKMMPRKTIWCLAVLLLFSVYRAEAQLKLEVKITNITDLDGQPVLLGVYRLEDGFPKATGVWKNQAKKATQASLSFHFDLPPGEYAFAVFHDKNNSRKIDKNWVGYPSEPFGFSRNFVPRFGPPRFKDCAIRLNQDGQRIEIQLIQP